MLRSEKLNKYVKCFIHTEIIYKLLFKNNSNKFLYKILRGILKNKVLS